MDVTVFSSEEHHWIGAHLDPTGLVGFVYAIVNKPESKIYIGKKSFWATRRVKLKGRKNRKIKKYGNKWEHYTGSSKSLNTDIDRLGKDCFTFVAIEAFASKGDLHYAELSLQVMLHALPDARCYNGNIAACKFIPPCEATLPWDGGKQPDTSDELIAAAVIQQSQLVRRVCREATELLHRKVGDLLNG